MSKLEKGLVVAALGLAAALVAGTAYALAAGLPARKAARAAVPPAAIAALAARDGIYDAIGRVRARTADGAIAVAAVAFAYDEGDRPFAEELRLKRAELKAAAEAFFASRRSEELNGSAEASLKAGLRDQLNARLTLGRIGELYLSELQIIP